MAARLDFFYFDAGGGHRAAATALKDVIEQQGRPWQVRLVNLNDVLGPTDVFRKLTGLGLQDIYNSLLRRGWTLGMSHLVPPMHRLIRLFHSTEVRLLRRFWASDPPDIVVSLIPQFNRAMFEAFQAVRAGAPYVTIITDFADYPPHFWLEPQPQHVIVGTEKARDQALDMGIGPETVHLVSGMILRPQFYESQEVDRAAGRVRLGLKPDVITGLVLFGGFGSPQMTQIVRKLQPLAGSLQLILICGRNEKLARRLRALRSRLPLHVEGFTQEIPYFMRLADFFIGKPGPGSISEAIAIGLPVIVECNDWTMPQERYNADWVGSRDIGVVVRSFRDILPAVDRLLERGTLGRLQANAIAIRNRAVFEIADILARLERAQSQSGLQ